MSKRSSPQPSPPRPRSKRKGGSDASCFANQPLELAPDHRLFSGPVLWANLKPIVDRLSVLGWLPGEKTESLLKKDDVNDRLRQAIMSYQAFFKVGQVPGVIDDETLASMKQQRMCGHPDLMPVQSALGAWAKKNLKWFLNTNDWPRIGRDAAIEAFRLGWQMWADVCDIHPSMANSAAEADVVTTLNRIDGPFGTLAYSFIPSAGYRGPPLQQQFDGEEPWGFGNVPNGVIDLVRVSGHEIFHALGGGHIEAGNLLAPVYSPQIAKPQAGDIREAVARYGPVQSLPPPPTTTPPPTTPVPSSGTSTVTITISAQVRDGRVIGWDLVR